jgi:hypothetical protein
VEVCLGGSELQCCPPELARLLKLILWSDFSWGITYLLTSRVSPLFLDGSLDSASESGPRVKRFLLPSPDRCVPSCDRVAAGRVSAPVAWVLTSQGIPWDPVRAWSGRGALGPLARPFRTPSPEAADFPKASLGVR